MQFMEMKRLVDCRASVSDGSAARYGVTNPGHRDTTIIFHHIPKTAGSTLESILERHFSPREIFDVDRSRNVHESLLASMSYTRRAGIRLIKGHMDFGVHRYVPNPFVYITVLRHPTERVISHYYYVKRSPDHRLHARVVSTKMSLEEYITSGIALELNNGQVRSLVGPAHLSVEYGRCTRDMLGTALHNLESAFSVVGLTERFDETLLLLKRRLGWSAWPFYRPKNVSKTKPHSTSLPRDVIALIEAHNELDLELYEAAQHAFSKEITMYKIREELPRFQRLNQVWGPCIAPFDVLRSVRRRLRSNEDDPSAGGDGSNQLEHSAEGLGQSRQAAPRNLSLQPLSTGEATNEGN